MPFLNVSVMVVSAPKPKTDLIYALQIHTDLHQSVALTRDPKIIVWGGTWNVNSIEIVSKNNLRSIREKVNGAVDIFINDYLAVNPKK